MTDTTMLIAAAQGDAAVFKARVAELEAALKFYADKMSWVSDSPIATPARRDQGRIARAALQRDRRPG